jgi:hypothetical protein
VLDAPVQIELPVVDFERSACIEIRTRRGRGLVTVIELLRPSNKSSGEGRDQYLANRAELLAGPVNFIEIDLSRGFPRMPLCEQIEGDYYVLVRSDEAGRRVGVWPMRLREPLSAIRVPLRWPHSPARLDLQELLHRVYDRTYYQDYIYEEEPRLPPDDAAWTRQFVPPRGP